MADLNISGRTTVRKFREEFKKAFGSSLRVYLSPSCKGRMADDSSTLASIRAKDAKGGDLTVKGNKMVGNFEKEFVKVWGIGVQVANADDSALADNSATLTQAGK